MEIHMTVSASIRLSNEDIQRRVQCIHVTAYWQLVLNTKWDCVCEFAPSKDNHPYADAKIHYSWTWWNYAVAQWQQTPQKWNFTYPNHSPVCSGKMHHKLSWRPSTPSTIEESIYTLNRNRPFNIQLQGKETIKIWDMTF